jgi:ATP-dependent Clp protease ATP-binding subunit ClpA/ATP-dependent Clp protease ATP-binding subunit ClpC
MTATFTVPIYQRKLGGGTIALTTLGLGPFTRAASGPTIPRADQLLRDALKTAVASARPSELLRFDLKRGTRLERVRLEINIKEPKRRKVSGLCPIVIEPRFTRDGAPPVDIAYHPARQSEWFPVPKHATLAEAAAAYFGDAWSDVEDTDLVELWSNTKDSLRVMSFSAQERTLLDELPERKKGIWDDLEIDPAHAERRKRQPLKVLPQLGSDLTAAGSVELVGLPRQPYRAQLEVLISGKRRQSVVLVGPSGCGKSTLVKQLVADLLLADGFTAHRNLDKVTHVWRIHGKQLIAGMSRVGQWEQRCVDLADDVRGRKIVLLVPDLHLFGRIGRARDSDRALSDFFRGPVARGDVVMIGECTPEQLARLQEDDPAFASSFVPLHVPAASRGDTFRMMLARAREIEAESPEAAPIEIEPLAFQTILELSEGLYPAHALPGKAVDLLARLCSTRLRNDALSGVKAEKSARVIGPTEVIDHLSRDTGLPWILLSPEKPLAVSEIEADLTQRVMGQSVAVKEAADLVVRIRSGLSDPKRPLGVYLFTGPTGTGKTELAKALAEYLYGTSARLVRFDMSELSGPDAVARLIGDAWDPDGALTSAVIAQPFCVVLLDEIEKAHPAVLNLLLQLFDEGRLTDAAGSTASFTQAVIVMTSNLGTRQRAPVGFDAPVEGLMHDIARAVREFFPPELFNRMDAVVPFRPLTPEVAVDVTRKELAKMFGRAGLIERNVFVQVGASAVDRIAHDSLRAEDGARSLKRFIEDRIGTLISEEIAKAPGAVMQVLSVAERPHGLVVESEPLTEAKPVALRYALEEIWTKPLAELRAELPAAAEALERIHKSEDLERLSDELRRHLSEHNRGQREHGETLYNIEWLRMTIDQLRQRIERLTFASREIEYHAIESAIAAREVAVYADVPWKSDPKPVHRALSGRMRPDFGGAGTFWDVFTAIAETYVLERALSKVTGADQHAVLVELSPFGAQRRFLLEMMQIYATTRDSFDSVAWVARGEVHDGSGAGAMQRALAAPPDFAVLKLVGLCIKDYVELENGTHVWLPSVREPELLRVRVLPATTSAKEHVRAFMAARDDRLLPVVRKIRFDPPLPRRPANLLEMDDFVLGMPYEARVTKLADAFARLWLLRMSRVEAPS